MNDGYKTLLQRASDEYVVKRSRFIATALPVKTEKEALVFISEIKSKYWDATHNVYAYSLNDGFVKRYSDDGEPQGTAGMPVLNVLTSGEVTDCAVVVTRYFGGVLLGTGGLVRAYSHSAKLGLDAAKIITLVPWSKLVLSCDYTFYAKIEQLVRDSGGKIESSDFGETVTLGIMIEKPVTDDFLNNLTEATNGKVSAKITGEVVAAK